jgi:hypothetical protein
MTYLWRATYSKEDIEDRSTFRITGSARDSPLRITTIDITRRQLRRRVGVHITSNRRIYFCAIKMISYNTRSASEMAALWRCGSRTGCRVETDRCSQSQANPNRESRQSLALTTLTRFQMSRKQKQWKKNIPVTRSRRIERPCDPTPGLVSESSPQSRRLLPFASTCIYA